MKAKEAAKMINEAPPEKRDEIMASICQEFFRDAEELRQARHAKTGLAIKNIYDEMHLKWRALASRCPWVNPDGFALIVRELSPLLFEVWNPSLKTPVS